MMKKIKDFLEKSEDEPIEFDVRYSTNIKEKIKERKEQYKKLDLFGEWIKENKGTIEKIKKNSSRPKSMNSFDELFTTDKAFKRLLEEKEKGKKIVGILCVQVPEELIYAAGAIPIRLCSGHYGATKPAEEAYPKDSCSLIKSFFGQVVTDQHFFSICDVIIIPSTCDGKKKLAEVLNDYKPTWVMDLPQSKDKTLAKKYWLAEARILKERLEKLTKNKIDKKSLKKSIELLQKRSAVLRRFLEVKKSKTQVISGCDSFLVFQSAFFDDIHGWMKKTEELCLELEKNVKEKKEVKKNNLRILLTGAPTIVPNFKIPLLIESFNANIIIDETCGGSQPLYDPVVVDEWNMQGMMSAISERYIMPSVCPCFIKSEDRIDKILDLIKEYDIQGVIYHTLRLCVLFDVESFKIKTILDSKKIPFLHLNADYSKEDEEQLKTRIEAFTEIIS